MKRLVQPGTVRAPRCRVLVDGAPMGGALSIDVASNSHFQADTFRVTFALAHLSGASADWWMAKARRESRFDIRIALDGDEKSMLIGCPDSIGIRPEAGTVEVEGRDLSAKLIDLPIQSAFQNRTSSEIAMLIGAQVGLTPVVTATTTPVSRYYGADHDLVQRSSYSTRSKAWDLLASLAENEGFDLFVVGTELHFQPSPNPSQVEPYVAFWDSNENRSDVKGLTVRSDLSIAPDDLVVEVRVVSSREGRAFTKTAGADPKREDVRKISCTCPNLTEAQAQTFADQRCAEIVKHGFKLDFECPGELDLTPRDLIALRGFGEADQTYFVDTINRRLSQRGFEQEVCVKNKHPNAEGGSRR